MLQLVVLYPKDTEKWKQFTTFINSLPDLELLFCIPKILKNESNSQQNWFLIVVATCCFVSQRYWKMKAIHNDIHLSVWTKSVVLYPKDTEKWKQFTTLVKIQPQEASLFCIPKILKNESNSQHQTYWNERNLSCFVSQRYWKMKAIHNYVRIHSMGVSVVLYPKDTEKWKQFTTVLAGKLPTSQLFCIPKILKNESNSQLIVF